jgi:hypothetical protein
MTTTLIAQVDDNVKLESILALFKRLHIPFKNVTSDSASNDAQLWNFPESDLDWQSIGLKALADDADWNSSFDDHWGELYDKTKNLEAI